MADSLLFDGTDDKIVFNAGDFSTNLPDAFSMFAVCKRGSLTTYDALGYGGDSGVAGKFGFSIKDTDNLLGDTNQTGGQGGPDGGSSQGSTTTQVTSTTTWYALGYTKAAGSLVYPRFHRWDYVLEGWAHEVGAGFRQSAVTGTLDQFLAGAWFNSGGDSDFFHGNIALIALWNVDLGGDAGVEAAFPTPTLLQEWVDANPLELLRLNSLSTLSSLTGAMTETSRTGTTLDTGDVPPGWDDTLSGGGTPQTVLPDADTTTTGWTSTPLFSKVNDASDATVIQATLV